MKKNLIIVSKLTQDNDVIVEFHICSALLRDKEIQEGMASRHAWSWTNILEETSSKVSSSLLVNEEVAQVIYLGLRINYWLEDPWFSFNPFANLTTKIGYVFLLYKDLVIHTLES